MPASYLLRHRPICDVLNEIRAVAVVVVWVGVALGVAVEVEVPGSVVTVAVLVDAPVTLEVGVDGKAEPIGAT